MRAEDLPLARHVVLLGILAILGAVRFSTDIGTGPFGQDGAFYVNAARNVHEGVGLKTNVSMYHYGLLNLPAPSHLIYPLWPLLMGYTGRAIGFFRAVDLLPKILYLLDLVLLYMLANAISKRMARSEPASLLTPAHWLVVLVGLNHMFFASTTFPYTEGLAFAFAFPVLLLLDRGSSRFGIVMGAAAGVSAGLALLVRTQMVVIGLAAGIALVVLAVVHRAWRRATVAYAGAFGVIALFWYYVLSRRTSGPAVELPPFQMWSTPQSTAEFWVERLRGMVISVTPASPYSYFSLFGPAFALVLVAGVLAIVRLMRSGKRSWWPGEDSVIVMASIVAAIGFHASLSLFHHDGDVLIPWMFGYRHGLPMIFALIPAVIYLFHLGRVLRLVVIVALTLSIVIGGARVVHLITTPPSSAPKPAEKQLAVWLDAHPRPPTILTTRAQHLSVYTHASIHWTVCNELSQQTRLMLARLPIDYVIVYPEDRPCRVFANLGDVLVVKQRFSSDQDRVIVLGRRRS